MMPAELNTADTSVIALAKVSQLGREGLMVERRSSYRCRYSSVPPVESCQGELNRAAMPATLTFKLPALFFLAEDGESTLHLSPSMYSVA